MNKKCICGGEMTECKLNTSVLSFLQVEVPHKYNFPRTYSAKAYMCKECGKVDIYADIENKENT